VCFRVLHFSVRFSPCLRASVVRTTLTPFRSRSSLLRVFAFSVGSSPRATKGASMAIAFRAVTTLAQAAATTVTLPVPPGVVAGALPLAVSHGGGGTGTAIRPPAGWELVLRTNDGVTQATAVYRRRALPDLPPSHSFTITSAACVAAMLAYGGADQASPIDAA